MDRTEYSPDGQYRVDYWQDEVRMGWWISAPTIVHQQTGETLFNLAGDVDAQVQWQSSGQIVIAAVHTYTRAKFSVWLDPANDAAWIEQEPDKLVPMSQASALAAAYVAPLDRKGDALNQQAQRRAREQAEEYARLSAAEPVAATAPPTTTTVEAEMPPQPQPQPDAPEPEPEPEPGATFAAPLAWLMLGVAGIVVAIRLLS